jgi:hypothetical protein
MIILMFIMIIYIFILICGVFNIEQKPCHWKNESNKNLFHILFSLHILYRFKKKINEKNIFSTAKKRKRERNAYRTDTYI